MNDNSRPRVENVEPTRLIRTSAEFVADFKPPDYLIDGLIQRRFLYSMTAPTNLGKTAIALCLAFHVAEGKNLGSREVVKGRVLHLAGENPDDVRMRWIKMCADSGLEPRDVDVRFVDGSYKLSQIRKQIQTESATHGPFVLVIVDTSVAYSDTEDENDNVQMGKYARTLRSLIKLPDGPTILVTCHPPKNVTDPDDYLPRGGGSYVAEMDTNLICMKEPHGQLVQLHWRRKIRGVDFAPIPFGIQYGTTERLKDSRGRLIYTVTARLFTAEEQTHEEERMEDDEDRLLVLMRDRPRLSMAAMAEALNWRYSNGEANKSRVQRTMTKLKREKLVKEARKGKWIITSQGTTAAAEIAIRNSNGGQSSFL